MLTLRQAHQETVANLLIISFLVFGLLGLYAQSKFPDTLVATDENYRKMLFRFIGLFFNCFSGCIIVIIWLNVTLDRVQKKLDLGLAWLAVAILLWCMVDLILIFARLDGFLSLRDYQIDWIIASISILNSVCFLYSIKYIKFGEQTAYLWFIAKIRALPKCKIFIEKIFISIFSSNKFPVLVTLTLLLLSILIAELVSPAYAKLEFLGFKIKTANLPDIALSLFTTAALIVVFVAYFKDKKFKYMNYMVWLVSIVILLAHWFYLTDLKGFSTDIIANIYRPFIIIIFFIISAGELRSEKERLAKFQRRDMNHAIRGTLNILQDDINNQINDISNQMTSTEEDAPSHLKYIKTRVEAMYILHDLVNKESDEKLGLQNYIHNILESIKTGLNYADNQFKATIEIDSKIKVSRTRARKLGSIFVELAINANRVANDKRKKQKDFSKKLNIVVQLNKRVLAIKVEDNGVYIDEQKALSKNRGLQRLYAIVCDDLKGEVNVNTNDMGGTTFNIRVPLANKKNS